MSLAENAAHPLRGSQSAIVHLLSALKEKITAQNLHSLFISKPLILK